MSSRRSVYILLGSNLNRPRLQLEKAKSNIEACIGKVIKTSSIYKTAPWGYSDQPAFYNQVIKLYSSKSGIKILKLIKEIEQIMGRVLQMKWGPRIIDIDILFIGYQRIKNKDLIVPHPRIAERLFVLAPLNEIIPHFIHPVSKNTVHTLFNQCNDHLNVRKVK